jgi:tetratricopeptide (TPR) repeat protein
VPRPRRFTPPPPLLVLSTALVALLALGGCHGSAPLPPRAVAMNRLGAAAMAAGDLATAEARLAIALEYSPDFTEAWVNLGLVDLRAGRVDRAKRELLRARSLNADLPAPHHALGVLAEATGKAHKAEAHYRAALAVDPGFGPARASLGRVLYADRRFEEAHEQFLRLTELAPELIEGWTGVVETLLRLGRTGEADLATARAREFLGDRPALVVLTARQLLRGGAVREAEAILSGVTRSGDTRTRASAWAWIGVARLADGRRSDAAAAAREALALQPGDDTATFVRAMTREQVGSAQEEERGRRE